MEKPALRTRDFFVTLCAETEGSVVQYAKKSMLERSLTARSLRAIDLDRVEIVAQRWLSLQHQIDKPEILVTQMVYPIVLAVFLVSLLLFSREKALPYIYCSKSNYR